MNNFNENCVQNATSPHKSADIKDLKKRLGNVGLMTLIASSAFLIISLLLSFIIQVVTENHTFTDDTDALINNIYGGLLNLSALGICGAIFIKVKKDSIYQQLPLEKVGNKKTIQLIFIGFSVCMLANSLTSLFLDTTKTLGFNFNFSGESVRNNSLIEAIVYILSVAFVPAISEEILFRGALMSTLRKYGDGTAILISAVIFALFHGNLVQIPFAFIVGLVLGWIVAYSNSILPAILVHFFNNLFSVICSLLQSNAYEFGLNIENLSVIINVFIVISLFLSLWFAMKISRQDRSFLVLNNYYGDLTKSEIKKAIFKNPLLITAVVTLSIMTLFNHIL